MVVCHCAGDNGLVHYGWFYKHIFVIEYPTVEDLVRGQHKLSGSLMHDIWGRF